MCILGEKTNHKDSPAYACAKYIFFTNSSATCRGDKDFGGRKTMIT